MKKLPYREGDVFGVPLDTGGFALGLAARVPPKGKSLLGYFFSTVYPKPPSIAEIPKLKKEDAIFVAILGDLGLYKGYWPIIGHLDLWESKTWPMPLFVRTDIISGEQLLVEYADHDPTITVDERPVGRMKTMDLPEDALWGYGAIEEKMTDLLSGK